MVHGAAKPARLGIERSADFQTVLVPTDDASNTTAARLLRGFATPGNAPGGREIYEART